MSRCIRFGFTLIELLIVVAIIAILAAIAVPNFLEAQVRAKTARAKADMRTIATGIESYRIDWNRYPPNDGRFYSTPLELTTPQAYLTSRYPDPFSIGRDIAAVVGVTLPPGRESEEEMYSYWGIVTFEEGAMDPVRNSSPTVIDFDFGGNRNALEKYGRWLQFSIGPDGLLVDEAINDISFSGLLGTPSVAPWGYSFDVPYDPTNGSISFGNIQRCQLLPEGTKYDPDLE
jgi:prepilin-type N-terminal cleavage/methylation domain-containing protein